MSILLPGENRIIYPKISLQDYTHGLILSYIYNPFENFLIGIDEEKIGSLKSIGKTNNPSDHYLNLNLILIENIRKIFDQIKHQSNFDFLKNNEKTYEYMLKFEIFKQLQSSIELEHEDFSQRLKKAGLILPENYFFLNQLIQKTNDIQF